MNSNEHIDLQEFVMENISVYDEHIAELMPYVQQFVGTLNR